MLTGHSPASFASRATALLLSASLTLPAFAAPPSAAPAPAPVAPADAPPAAAPAPLDKDLVKEIAKGPLLKQLESKKKLQDMAYHPPAKLLQPYANGTLGAPLSYDLISGTPFVDAPAAQALAQRVVDRLLGSLDGWHPDVRVYVIADPTYQAKATEAGNLLVSLGVFNSDPNLGVASVDELALLLGHELGHNLLGHMRDRRQMRALISLMNGAASAFLDAASYSRSKMVNGKLQQVGDAKLQRHAYITSLAISTVIADLLMPSFDRKREMEADRFGFDLAHKAGYMVDADTAQKFLSRQAVDDTMRSRRMQALDVVLRAILTQLGKKAADKIGGQGGQLASGVMGMLQDRIVSAIMSGIESQTKLHPDPTERINFLTKYIERNYGDPSVGEDGKLLSRDVPGVTVVNRDARLSTLIRQVKQASEVQEALAEANPDADTLPPTVTDTVIQKAAATTPAAAKTPAKGKKKGGQATATASAAPAQSRGFANDDAPYTLEVEGAARASAGAPQLAELSWRRGMRSNYSSMAMAQQLGNVLPADKDVADIDALIAKVGKQVGTTDPVIELTVESAMAKGDVAGAEVAAARCSTYDIGSHYPRCVGALGYDPLAQGGAAKTPEGMKAFAGKAMERNIAILTSIAGIKG